METNKIKRFWIWFWYNDVTRFGVLFGAYLPLIAVCLYRVGLDAETIKKTLAFIYLSVFWLAVFDNDYSKLRRIVRDKYKRKLKL